jgi:hypothetical protein
VEKSPLLEEVLVVVIVKSCGGLNVKRCQIVVP